MNLFGIPVVESHLAMLPEPNRTHRRTRHQSLSYHQRIQKKWNKRFGTTLKPAVLFIGDVSGITERESFILHPTILAAIRNIQS